MRDRGLGEADRALDGLDIDLRGHVHAVEKGVAIGDHVRISADQAVANLAYERERLTVQVTHMPLATLLSPEHAAALRKSIDASHATPLRTWRWAT